MNNKPALAMKTVKFGDELMRFGSRSKLPSTLVFVQRRKENFSTFEKRKKRLQFNF